MPPRRMTTKRLVREKGLGSGVPLERAALPSKPVDSVNGTDGSPDPWGWVLRPVQSVEEITDEHLLRACGISLDLASTCPNKYAKSQEDGPSDESPRKKQKIAMDVDAVEADVIIVSSDDECTPLRKKSSCSKKACKGNPRCLNYLGQDMWEDENKSKAAFTSRYMQSKSHEDPTQMEREENLPIGLKNLGATCYANALLQVWFNNPSFVAGVYAAASASMTQNIPNSTNRDDLVPLTELARTFAHLQSSKSRYFNPERLVDSLGLRTEEQQDAQEFAKLFMELLSHSDAENRLHEVVAQQFEGKRSYGTRCHACKSVSEREEAFLELELNLQDGVTLEELMLRPLESEDLDQDNLYECPSCNTRSTATRTAKLTSLPPVLHFSLMRFVFDARTYTKRKSKASIRFPRELDVSPLLGNRSDPLGSKYHLRGLLLHKGPNAHQGHYVCQILSVDEGEWFQYDDEHILLLGDAPEGESKGSRKAPNDGLKTLKRKVKEPRQLKLKKKSITSLISDDSEDELNVIEVDKKSVSPLEAAFSRAERRSSPIRKEEPKPPSRFSSKDVYMLIYTRTDLKSMKEERKQISPPSVLVEEVAKHNKEHAKICAEYRKRLDYCNSIYQSICEAKQAIYRTWHASSKPDEIPLIAAAAPLTQWLTQELSTPKTSKSSAESHKKENNPDPGPELKPSDGPSPMDVDEKSEVLTGQIDNSSITCSHGFLDPLKGQEMKVIYSEAIRPFLSPPLTALDVCRECVSNIFMEKASWIKHNSAVDSIKEQMAVEEPSPGAWVSKHWLKEWSVKIAEKQSQKKRPSPQEPDYMEDVLCEHGLLQPDVSHRRILNGEAVAVILELFMDWHPLPEDTPVCETCSAREESELAQIQAQVIAEKKLLLESFSEMQRPQDHDPRAVSWEWQEAVAIIPYSFASQWNRWIRNPQVHDRPESIDNSFFLCEHSQLIIDFANITKFDPEYALIDMPTWDKLCTLYQAGPLLAFYPEGSSLENESAKLCAGCHIDRKSDFRITQLTVLHVHPEHPMSDATLVEAPDVPVSNGNTGVRRSVRVSNTRGGILHRATLKVAKTDTVLHIKRKAATSFNIGVSSQKLFYGGIELEKDDATMADIKLLTNSTVYLKEASIEIGDDEDMEPELGFTGTKLFGSSRQVRRAASGDPQGTGERSATPSGQNNNGNCNEKSATDRSRSASHPDQMGGLTSPSASPAPGPSQLAPSTEKLEDIVPSINCLACTFSNAPDAEECEMCGTGF